MTPTPQEVWHYGTRHIGRRVLVYDALESTNDFAAVLAADESEMGTLIVADYQTRGRGQYGRQWQSRAGCSLLASVIVRPAVTWNRPAVLTAWAAVAVGDAVEELTGTTPAIKWPNDLLVRGKKVCGILIEQTTATVVGIGLNLNQTVEDWAAADLSHAASLAEITGQPVEPHAAAGVLVKHLDDVFARLTEQGPATLENQWRWRLGLLGRYVTARLADDEVVAGTLMHISFAGIELDTGDGGFRVLLPEGIRALSAAESACSKYPVHYR